MSQSMSHSCELCRAPKAPKSCSQCGRHACKNCLRYLESGQLRFHPSPPAFASASIFCADCFETDVAPVLAHYEEVLERSQSVTLVRASYRGFLPCLRKAQAITRVEEESDRDEAVARLRFLAAWEGYDAVAELETESRKVRNHGWENKAWSARGLFMSLDHKRFRPPDEDG